MFFFVRHALVKCWHVMHNHRALFCIPCYSWRQSALGRPHRSGCHWLAGAGRRVSQRRRREGGLALARRHAAKCQVA